MFGAEFWVAVAFFIFVGFLLYKGVHHLIIDVLDKKAVEIKKNLEEAHALRSEAQALLAEQQKAQKDAARQIKEIAALATQEAETQATEIRTTLDATVERRTRLAQEKIALAEANAVKEVREVVIDAATEAARELLADALKGAGKADSIDEAIESLNHKVH